MNVTTEIRNNIEKMGGSGSSRQDYLSANKSLNFSRGSNNLNTAPSQRISSIPLKVNFKDSVGLQGSENLFIKIDLEILDSISVFANLDIRENGYYPVWQTIESTATINGYDTAIMDFSLDPVNSVVNQYLSATLNNDLSDYGSPIVSIEMSNLKTGNQYLDNWLDVALYTRSGQRIDEDKFFIPAKDYFYVGFHARNTRRIPINVEIQVGNEFFEKNQMNEEQRRLIV